MFSNKRKNGLVFPIYFGSLDKMRTISKVFIFPFLLWWKLLIRFRFIFIENLQIVFVQCSFFLIWIANLNEIFVQPSKNNSHKWPEPGKFSINMHAKFVCISIYGVLISCLSLSLSVCVFFFILFAVKTY